MKTNYLNYILSIFVILILISCTESDNDPKRVQDKIEDDMSSGTWRITKFIDSGKNETSDFSNYTFSFNQDDILIAQKASGSFTGTWNISDDNSSDDSIDDLDFNIHFSSSDDLEELSEDWSIISNSSKKIELIHVSGGNGGTDLLTFEKN